MSFFRFFKRRKEAVSQVAFSKEQVEEGIEAALQKKQREIKDSQKDEELVLEDYEPKLPLDETIQEIKESIMLTHSKEECLQALRENCEQILECEKQSENAKIEYQAVTEYMSDLQKIERMEQGEKNILIDAANKVIAFTKEREAYQSREVHTTDSCFRAMRNYDGSLQEELKKMRENEQYSQLVKNDMRLISLPA